MTRTSQWLYGWLLLLPAAALLALFTHYPAAATLWQSFHSTPKAGRGSAFVGVDNYRALADDPIFWQSLSNNLWYAGGTIPLSIALALLMAAWVNGKLPGRGLLRLAYFTPTVLPMIAVANIWLFFYTPEYGLLQRITSGFGIQKHNWLGGQDHRATALLHLRDRVPLLGPGVCGHADDRAARRARACGAWPVRIPGAQGALSMSAAVYRAGTLGRSFETAGAWLLGALWLLPLAY